MIHTTAHTDPDPIIEDATTKLLNYCESNDWAGYDPFDGLNSKVFKALPFNKYKLPRLAFIQFMKRFPINLRRVLLVPKEQNPKGLALFVSALLRLSKTDLFHDANMVESLAERLIALRSKGYPHACWGYNFDWQNRVFFLPKYSPNIICTTFAANALLDFHEKYRKPAYVDLAVSAGDFILSGLNITHDSSGICFSYTPFDKGQVHNANLLGAAFLARLYRLTGKKAYLDEAHKAVNYSVSRQKEDGSWAYGEARTQGWVDNFHTGYNLGALEKFSQYSRNFEFSDVIKTGYQFYRNNLFYGNCIPKYFNNKVFPIDIHAISQSIITPIEMKDYDKDGVRFSVEICRWAINNMQSKRDTFSIKKRNFTTIQYPICAGPRHGCCMPWQPWCRGCGVVDLLIAMQTTDEHE